MPVLKPRNRLVYFRISDDEFKQFCEMCKSEGARSRSDLARSALRRLLQDGAIGIDQTITQKLTALEGLLGELRLQIERLSHSFGCGSPKALSTAFRSPVEQHYDRGDDTQLARAGR